RKAGPAPRSNFPVGGEITIGSWMSPDPPVRSKVLKPVGTDAVNRTGMVVRVMKFHLLAPLPYRGSGRMGWKINLLPIFGSPRFTSPSAKLRSKRANNAHTS